jgi:hypothetical protein
MVAEGNCVAVRYVERGIFRGDFRGHAPTGKAYEFVTMEWFTIKDGKIQTRRGWRTSTGHDPALTAGRQMSGRPAKRLRQFKATPRRT